MLRSLNVTENNGNSHKKYEDQYDNDLGSNLYISCKTLDGIVLHCFRSAHEAAYLLHLPESGLKISLHEGGPFGGLLWEISSVIDSKETWVPINIIQLMVSLQCTEYHEGRVFEVTDNSVDLPEESDLKRSDHSDNDEIIYCYSLDSKLLCSFSSISGNESNSGREKSAISQCCNLLNLDELFVSACCKGMLNFYSGYRFSHELLAGQTLPLVTLSRIDLLALENIIFGIDLIISLVYVYSKAILQ